MTRGMLPYETETRKRGEEEGEGPGSRILMIGDTSVPDIGTDVSRSTKCGTASVRACRRERVGQ
eukprot:2473383-Rhodomonas_salina.1